MARIQFETQGDLSKALMQIEKGLPEIAKRAVYKGAEVIANQVKKELDNLPIDNRRAGNEKKKLQGVSRMQKEDLRHSMGISKIREESGNYDASVGFDGYGSIPSKKYPQGLPNQLLVRSVESGTSFRRKIPFMRRASAAAREKAQDAMQMEILSSLKRTEEET